MNKHIKKVHAQASHKCGQCGRRFTDKGNLKAHLKTHEGTKYPCEQCDKVYNSSKSLDYHNRTIHSKIIYKYFCKICDYKTHKSQIFKLHMRIHTGEKPFKCDICNTKFYQQHHLKSHKKYCNDPRGRYKCIDCGACFKTADESKNHKKTYKHTYPCKECTKIFQSKQGHQYHIKNYHMR